MKTLLIIIIITTSSFVFARGHDIGERFEAEAQIDQVNNVERSVASSEKNINPFDHIDKKDRFKIRFEEK